MPLDFVGGLIDTASNMFTSERNKQMSQDVLDEQKRLNNFNMDWQMNKYKYSSQDLANSGFSKAALLNQAPGPAASLSAGNAPTVDYRTNFKGLYHNFLNNRNLVAQEKLIDNTATKAEAETAFIKTRELHEQNKIFETIANTALKEAESDKVREQILQIKKEVETMAYNLEHSKDAKIRTNDAVNGLYNTLNSAAGMLGSELIDKAIDIAMLVLPGLGLFKGAKYIGKLPAVIKYIKTQGIPAVKKGFDAFLKKFGLSKKDFPSPSDFFG